MKVIRRPTKTFSEIEYGSTFRFLEKEDELFNKKKLIVNHKDGTKPDNFDVAANYIVNYDDSPIHVRVPDPKEKVCDLISANICNLKSGTWFILVKDRELENPDVFIVVKQGDSRCTSINLKNPTKEGRINYISFACDVDVIIVDPDIHI